MRKLLSVLLAVSLLCSCCAVLAEGEETAFDFEGAVFPTVTGEGMSADVTEVEAEFAIRETTDTVVVSDATISVRAGAIIMMLTVPDAYRCFTQDYIASIRSYAAISDPESLLNHMFEHDLHFYLWDLYTTCQTQIGMLPADGVSTKVGNMNTLGEDDVATFGTLFGQSSGLEYLGVFKTDSATWMRFTGAANLYVTVAGGQYIVYYSNDAATEDVQEVLRNLTIYG